MHASWTRSNFRSPEAQPSQRAVLLARGQAWKIEATIRAFFIWWVRAERPLNRFAIISYHHWWSPLRSSPTLIATGSLFSHYENKLVLSTYHIYATRWSNLEHTQKLSRVVCSWDSLIDMKNYNSQFAYKHFCFSSIKFPLPFLPSSTHLNFIYNQSPPPSFVSMWNIPYQFVDPLASKAEV